MANICNPLYNMGEGFSIAFPVTNPDGTPFAPSGLAAAGCTVTAQIRDTASSTTARLQMTVQLDYPVASSVRCSFTAAQAASALQAVGVTFSQLTTYVWECDLTQPGSDPVRLLEGSFSVSPGGNV